MRIKRLLALMALGTVFACTDDQKQTPPKTTPPDMTSDVSVSDMPAPDMPKEDMEMMPDLKEVALGYTQRPSNTTCLAIARPKEDAQIKLTRVFPDVTMRQPIELIQAPGDSTQWFVVEQRGRIIRIDKSSGQSTEVLDLSAKVRVGNELGLLGLAFHPKWSENKKVYVSYNYDNPNTGLTSRIAQMTIDTQQWTIDASNEKVILEVGQPFTNHNGGQIVFGPDGYLYISLGDGGRSGDPLNSGQDTSTLLGNILRIDIDKGDPYAIPQDNPFAQNNEGRKEIFAYGFRNVWKMSFDPVSGQLWAGDVGQNEKEEVDLVDLGGNYGWKVREGDECYRNNPDCDKTFKEPVVVYDHSEGRSITGGYVYRGTTLPALAGKYLFADYVSGRIWGVFYKQSDGQPEARVLLASSGFLISSFGQDQDTGELFLLDYDIRNDRGAGIYRIDPQVENPNADPFPQQLSATGCVNPQDITKPAPGMIPYSVAEPFWSDGAKKTRYVALPDGTTITHKEDGSFEFPIGTVFVKHFKLQNKWIETRLFMRHEDGFWAGYTYEWNDAQTDATLVLADKRKQIGDQTWIYPSRAQCLSCHNSTAKDVLGFVDAQLQGKTAYPNNLSAPQRATLDHIQLFDRPLGQSPPETTFNATTDTSTSIEQRAKTYIDVNCAYCHLPGGIARGELDLRYTTPLGQMGLCDKTPLLDDLDINDGKLLAPGDPSKSITLERLKRRDRHGMPPIGSTVVDTRGVTLLNDWIAGLQECP